MEETIKKLRAIFLANLNRQLKNDTGISTRINLYLVEVQLLKDLFYVFTGMDAGEDDPDAFHDYCCDVIDTIHKEFDK